jgi:acyl-CoA dehydrogenase
MTPLDFDRDDLFSIENNFFSLAAASSSKDLRKISKLVEDERHFLQEQIAPLTLQEDRKCAEDHDYLSWEMVRRAGRHGRLSRAVPGFWGGSGLLLKGGSFNLFAEEAAAVDCAYGGLMGGHELGLTALTMTFNYRILQQVMEKIVAHQNDERPFLIDCAITEPTAGTDVEEIDFYDRAKLVARATRVPGGAVLNGSRIFISTGHMASEHVVFMTYNPKDPLEDYGCFLVPGDAPGFSLGRKERKMGQRVGPASELVFEDCFVPQERVVADTDDFPETNKKRMLEWVLHGVLGTTRIWVGAWSTGTARGAFERALALAKSRKHKGRTLINQQWVQGILSNMYMNVMTARAVYREAEIALLYNLSGGRLGSSMRGTPAIMQGPLARMVASSAITRGAVGSRRLRKRLLKAVLAIPEERMARIQYMSSLAKVVGSDMAMENSQLAVELLSQAGLRHDEGVEKIFRDSKLLQIFEGTNQLNRLNMFHHAIGRKAGVNVFRTE